MAGISAHRTFSQISPPDRRTSSPLTVAAVMAAIMAVFIAGIASVFIYSNCSSLTRTAQAPPAVYRLVDTTGSGGVK